MLHHHFIGDVHGLGLLIGIEFVWDKKEMTPAKYIANLVLYQ
jgi:4-aminobutyrate aminotransferase-like enzyme